MAFGRAQMEEWSDAEPGSRPSSWTQLQSLQPTLSQVLLMWQVSNEWGDILRTANDTRAWHTPWPTLSVHTSKQYPSWLLSCHNHSPSSLISHPAWDTTTRPGFPKRGSAMEWFSGLPILCLLWILSYALPRAMTHCCRKRWSQFPGWISFFNHV